MLILVEVAEALDQRARDLALQGRLVFEEVEVERYEAVDAPNAPGVRVSAKEAGQSLGRQPISEVRLSPLPKQNDERLQTSRQQSTRRTFAEAAGIAARSWRPAPSARRRWRHRETW